MNYADKPTVRANLERLLSRPKRGISGFSRNQIVEEIDEHGMIPFSFSRKEEVLEKLLLLGNTFPKSAGTDDPFYSVVSKEQHTYDEGARAFSGNSLEPHTDYAGEDQPPEIIALLCGEPAPLGGASLFVDGLALYQCMREWHPKYLEALNQHGAIFHRFPDHIRAVPIFEENGRGRIMLRARFDEFSFVRSDACQAFVTFMAIARQLSIRDTLQAGEGYILHNSRWLHGRDLLFGERKMYRLSIKVSEELSERLAGFTV